MYNVLNYLAKRGLEGYSYRLPLFIIMIHQYINDGFLISACQFMYVCMDIIGEAAVGERILLWIRTPQVPGSRPGWYGTFYRASD